MYYVVFEMVYGVVLFVFVMDWFCVCLVKIFFGQVWDELFVVMGVLLLVGLFEDVFIMSEEGLVVVEVDLILIVCKIMRLKIENYSLDFVQVVVIDWISFEI